MSQANSRPVSSNQTGPHPDLNKTLQRYLEHQFERPLGIPTQQAFQAIQPFLNHPKLILDAGCGVGESTVALAHQFPDAFVLGVDKSYLRVQTHAANYAENLENYRLLRADLVDFWRLLHQAGITLQRQYLLYPNPWPKAQHFKRRWHGHPIMPYLLQLGGYIEVRSNWKVYIQEFSAAVKQLTGVELTCETYAPDPPITPFERKYLNSGHQLYRCWGQLKPNLDFT